MSRRNREQCWLDWLERNMGRRMVWGEFDCALAGASVGEALTGTHPRPDLVGAYSTPLGAYRIIKEAGGLTQLFDEHYERTNPNRVQRGDLVLATDGRKETILIHDGRHLLGMAGGRFGIVTGLKTIRAWRVK